jgi:fructan beta-fructosidase
MAYEEQYRPQIHFSPKQHWINDPNGAVFYKGMYHLFFQYFPGGSVWGPTHWGHATSEDLIHWQEQQVALYPDKIGYIFSGSAVVDKNNTSGFGKDGIVPLVAIYAQNDPVREQAGKNDVQNQSIAYSVDDGKTWLKYANNPVLKNPGIKDFRDPNVIWYEPLKTWVMALATQHHITFYSSPDLKNWTQESEFGKTLGAHVGVWECPDLFSLDDDGRKIWVLLVSVNPGGPNKGSATQYFFGDFDGKAFRALDTITRWIDYGPDNYAGITWTNTGKRKIFLGWMSNWLYAKLVPTSAWRNAMTIPRELKLKRTTDNLYLAAQPVKELNKLESKKFTFKNISINKNFDLSSMVEQVVMPCKFSIHLKASAGFSIAVSNKAGEKILIGFDKEQNHYFIDRTHSGQTDFQEDFAAKHVAPRLTGDSKIDLLLILDESSVEFFADDGLIVMTDIFFPSEPYNSISIQSQENIMIDNLEYTRFDSIWKNK